jgi:hypothetical protein
MGAPVASELQQMGLFVEGFNMHSHAQKENLINKLAIYIEQKAIRIPKHQELLEELEAYKYTRTDYGITKYHAPRGKHDDHVIALALSVWELSTSNYTGEQEIHTGEHVSWNRMGQRSQLRNEYL